MVFGGLFRKRGAGDIKEDIFQGRFDDLEGFQDRAGRIKFLAQGRGDELAVQAGMPAEVYITTGERTAPTLNR